MRRLTKFGEDEHFTVPVGPFCSRQYPVETILAKIPLAALRTPLVLGAELCESRGVTELRMHRSRITSSQPLRSAGFPQ